MNIEEAMKTLGYKINMHKEDVFIGDLDKTNIEAIQVVLKEIERLTAESTEWESKFYNEAKKVDKAIEFIEKYQIERKVKIGNVELDKSFINSEGVLDILRGEDNE